MKKIQVRCYRAYVRVGQVYNIEVYYTLPDFGYYTELYTDLRTGEIYALEVGDNEISSKSIDEIVSNLLCPMTMQSLVGHLTKYPQSFLYKNEIGHFEPSMIIPEDENSTVKEFWEIA
jgi:hypothetical protein